MLAQSIGGRHSRAIKNGDQIAATIYSLGYALSTFERGYLMNRINPFPVFAD